jgi:hypothetical protein
MRGGAFNEIILLLSTMITFLSSGQEFRNSWIQSKFPWCLALFTRHDTSSQRHSFYGTRNILISRASQILIDASTKMQSGFLPKESCLQVYSLKARDVVTFIISPRVSGLTHATRPTFALEQQFYSYGTLAEKARWQLRSWCGCNMAQWSEHSSVKTILALTRLCSETVRVRMKKGHSSLE